jgi:pimeloyl-ACP methyl ester carboxylesterase
MKRYYINTPEGQLHCTRVGSGTPLVLCHQSPNSSRMFSAAMPLLAERGFCVLAIDTPGHGESTPPASEPEIDGYAAALLEGLRIEGLDSFCLLGHHTGAAIACAMAVAAPQRVRALVLNGPPLFSEDIRKQRRALPGLRISPVGGGEHLQELWNLRKRVTPGWTKIDVMQRGVVDLLRSGDCVHQGHAAVYRYDLRDALMQLAMPTMILTNTGEDLYQHSRQAHALRPDFFAYRELDGGTHDIVDEQPEHWTEAVAGFLESVDRG